MFRPCINVTGRRRSYEALWAELCKERGLADDDEGGRDALRAQLGVEQGVEDDDAFSDCEDGDHQWVMGDLNFAASSKNKRKRAAEAEASADEEEGGGEAGAGA